MLLAYVFFVTANQWTNMIIWLYIYCCTLNTHKYHIFVYNRSSFPEIRRTGLSPQIDEYHYRSDGISAVTKPRVFKHWMETQRSDLN